MTQVQGIQEDMTVSRPEPVQAQSNDGLEQAAGQQKWRKAAMILAMGAFAAHAQSRDIRQNEPAA